MISARGRAALKDWGKHGAELRQLADKLLARDT